MLPLSCGQSFKIVLRSKLIVLKHQTFRLPLSIDRSAGSLRSRCDVFSAKGAVQALAWRIAPGFVGRREALALKARLTGDVIRSIVGTALNSANGTFEIENITELNRAFSAWLPV